MIASGGGLKQCYSGDNELNSCLSEIILYMQPTNERRRYNVTSSLIGWAHIQNDPCLSRLSFQVPLVRRMLSRCLCRKWFQIQTLSSSALHQLGNGNNGDHIDGLVQDCGNYIANALELPQFYA